jgi:hypothetical protein
MFPDLGGVGDARPFAAPRDGEPASESWSLVPIYFGSVGATGDGVWLKVDMRIFQALPSRSGCGSGVFGYWAFFRGSSAGLMKVIPPGPVK